jgi:hypothetical protein
MDEVLIVTMILFVDQYKKTTIRLRTGSGYFKAAIDWIYSYVEN